MNRPQLSRITWNKAAQSLALAFRDGTEAVLSAEFLRVFSPSAEVRGHGGGEPMLVIGKSAVKLLTVEPVGRYAFKLGFDDGHDSGLYDMTTLYTLCQNHAALWQNYQARLATLGLLPAHDPPATVRITDVLARQSAQQPDENSPP
ncbi:gamma-butyrobetaine hydroxylase-like domain-containing protein [Halothiobacillus sp. DCM-1]|uniref:gamma-butyrobetaine hydroxylase-like domain-containing protein n=1 Tax=Halothiobacillus sp. DCM-1 TaxID=3112558 RepID=UPI00324E2B64